MATNVYYTQLKGANKTTCYMYGVISSIPTALRKSGVTLNYKISGSTNRGTYWRTGFSSKIIIKIKRSSGTTETTLKSISMSASASSMVITIGGTYDTTLNLSDATAIGFKFTYSVSKTWTGPPYAYQSDYPYTPTATVGYTVSFDAPANLSSETFITAALAKDMASLAAVTNSAATGSKITITEYNALATAVGASAFDSTSPKASDLSAMIKKLNSAEIHRSWSSTSSSDYDAL